VVPKALQNPEVLAALRDAAKAYGIPFERLCVGNAHNSINPNTGVPEFGMVDWIKGLPDRIIDAARGGQAYVAQPFERENPSAIISPPVGTPIQQFSDKEVQYDPKWSRSGEDCYE